MFKSVRKRRKRKKLPVVLLALLVTCSMLLAGSITALAESGSSGDSETCPKGGTHRYVITVQKHATEKKAGVRLYRCSQCGYEKTEEIPATGHVWGGWKTIKEATCTATGEKVRTCVKHKELNGQHKETKTIPAKGHKWGKWKVVLPATRKSDGLKEKVCANDPSHKRYETLPAIGPGSSNSGSAGKSAGMSGGSTSGSGITSSISGSIYSGGSGSSGSSDSSGAGNGPGSSAAGSGSSSAGGNTGNGSSASGNSGGSGSGSGTGSGGSGAETVSTTVPMGAADAAIIGANGAAIFIYALLLVPLFQVVLWVRRKRKEAEEDKQ